MNLGIGSIFFYIYIQTLAIGYCFFKVISKHCQHTHLVNLCTEWLGHTSEWNPVQLTLGRPTGLDVCSRISVGFYFREWKVIR